MYFSGLGQYLRYETLQQYYDSLQRWTEQHFLLSVMSYCGLYILAIALSIPGAVFLTLLGGFLFGLILGGVLVVFSATIGACVIFLAIRIAFGEKSAVAKKPWVVKMRHGFSEHAFSYLLVLRLIPLFPFWAVNIAPAILGVPFNTFFTATFLGIIPGSFVFVSIGNGLGFVLEQGKKPDLSILFSPYVLGPLLALAFLSLLPVFYKSWKERS